MANIGISQLKSQINATIRQNGQREITGAILNDNLIDIVDTLKNGGNLDNSSVSFEKLSASLLDTSQHQCILGVYVRSADGSVVENDSYGLTDYIPVTPGDIVTWESSGSPAVYGQAAYSDRHPSSIVRSACRAYTPPAQPSATNPIERFTFQVPTGVAYLRICNDTRVITGSISVTVLRTKMEPNAYLLTEEIGEFSSSIVECSNNGFVNESGAHSNNYYGYSEFIAVKAGDSIEAITAVGGTTFAISGYSSNNFSSLVKTSSVNILGMDDEINIIEKYTGIVDDGVNYIVLCCDHRVIKGRLVDLKITRRPKRKLDGKKVSVLGDSISAYQGLIPSGHAYAYPAFGVTAACQMWWDRLKRKLGFSIGCIEAWSGGGVSGTDDGQKAISESRLAALASNGTPDIILIQVATNDCDRDFGEFAFWKLKKGEQYDKTKFRQAYAFIVERLMQLYPLARIVCLTPLFRAANEWYNSEDAGPGYYNEYGYSMTDMVDSIVKIASEMHCEVIDLSRCGISSYNATTYLGDNRSGQPEYKVHPNKFGMQLMADYIERFL